MPINKIRRMMPRKKKLPSRMLLENLPLQSLSLQATDKLQRIMYSVLLITG